MDKVYVVSTIVGAVVNFLCNMIFINLYGAVGACIGTILAEFAIAIFQTISVWNDLDITIYISDLLLNIIKAILMGIIIVCIAHFIKPIIVRIILDIFVAIILFVVMDREYIFNIFLCKK